MFASHSQSLVELFCSQSELFGKRLRVDLSGVRDGQVGLARIRFSCHRRSKQIQLLLCQMVDSYVITQYKQRYCQINYY